MLFVFFDLTCNQLLEAFSCFCAMFSQSLLIDLLLKRSNIEINLKNRTMSSSALSSTEEGEMKYIWCTVNFINVQTSK